MLGTGTTIADDHVPVRINGDSALFKGIAKHLVENDAIDTAFIEKHTIGINILFILGYIQKVLFKWIILHFLEMMN